MGVASYKRLHVQDYLGKIDKDAPIVLKPIDLLSAEDLSANSLHVLDCKELIKIHRLKQRNYTEIVLVRE